MILIVFLLAPIVPSDPNPKNNASVTSSPKTITSLFTGNDLNVTSSTIPTVKSSFISPAKLS